MCSTMVAAGKEELEGLASLRSGVRKGRGEGEEEEEEEDRQKRNTVNLLPSARHSQQPELKKKR